MLVYRLKFKEIVSGRGGKAKFERLQNNHISSYLSQTMINLHVIHDIEGIKSFLAPNLCQYSILILKIVYFLKSLIFTESHF